MFDLQIDKKKKQKTKNCLQWIKVVNKNNSTYRFVQNWHSPTRGEHTSHYATDAVPYFYSIFIIYLIKISYCPSIYYLKTKINPKQ
jgi:hypothetical protein